MRWLAASIFITLAATASGADDTVCEVVAAKVRARNGVDWSQIWQNAALYQGTPPILEGPLNMAGHIVSEKNKGDFERALAETFHPEPALAKAFHEFPGGNSFVKVSKLQNGTLHALWLSSGNDDCRLFVFFDVPKNGPAKLLPDVNLPQGRECETDATIASVDGRPVFLLISGMPIRYEFDMELRSLTGNRWDEPCTVHVVNETQFVAEKIFLLKDGPIDRNTWRDIAPKILKAKLEAELAGKEAEFHYGPKLANERALPNLPSPNEDFTLPLFGAADEEISQYVMWRYERALWPLTVDGKLYAIRIGHRMPKKTFTRGPNYFVIAYDPDGLKPIASASVSIKPGPFQSATVTHASP